MVKKTSYITLRITYLHVWYVCVVASPHKPWGHSVIIVELVCKQCDRGLHNHTGEMSVRWVHEPLLLLVLTALSGKCVAIWYSKEITINDSK